MQSQCNNSEQERRSPCEMNYHSHRPQALVHHELGLGQLGEDFAKAGAHQGVLLVGECQTSCCGCGPPYAASNCSDELRMPKFQQWQGLGNHVLCTDEGSIAHDTHKMPHHEH